MITNNCRLKCDLCGKLMSWNDSYYTWTPYGSYNTIEPPDEEHAHKNCYEKWNIGLIERTSWIKPYFVNNIKRQRRTKLEKLNECK